MLLWRMQWFGPWELGLKPAHGAGPKPLGFPSQGCPRRGKEGAAEEERAEGRNRGLALLWSIFGRHSGAEVCSAQTLPPSLFLSLLLAVVFPQDLLEKGLEADNFAMLGLGDIVIPGKDRRGGT